MWQVLRGMPDGVLLYFPLLRMRPNTKHKTRYEGSVPHNDKKIAFRT